jgi:hypothetical protein
MNELYIDPTLDTYQHPFLLGQVVEWLPEPYKPKGVVFTKEYPPVGEPFFNVRGYFDESTVYYDMGEIYD